MPEHITDAELLKRSYSWWPLALLLKCTWLCIPIMGVAALIARAPLLFTCYILGCSLLLGLQLLFDLPKFPYRRELSYRKWKDEKWAWHGKDHAVARWSRERMAAPDAPDWLLTLRGVILPNARLFWMSFELRATGARFEAYHGAPLNPSPATTDRRDPPPVTHLTSTLDPTTLDSILAFLPEASRGRRVQGLPLEVQDGIPCALELRQRGADSFVRFDCNLAGPTPHPSKDLCQLLYQLGVRDLPSPPIFSATGPQGTTTNAS